MSTKNINICYQFQLNYQNFTKNIFEYNLKAGVEFESCVSLTQLVVTLV